MPRTVESILECHQAATELRRRRQPIWTGKLGFLKTVHPQLKAYRDGAEGFKHEELLAALKAAAAEVRMKVPEAKGEFDCMEHENLEYFVLGLEELTLESLKATTPQELVEEFDCMMDQLYDWCDRHRWWIEPSGC